MADSPRISVVIASYNSRRTLGRCLDSLMALDHPSFEVIVVDDGSTDGSPDICESYPTIRLIRLDRGGPSRARNRGIEAARGEIVAFTDSDCVVARDWLQELEKGFLDETVAGVGGDQVSPDGESEFGKTVQEYFRAVGFVTDYINLERTLTETRHNASCNSSYRKKVLEVVGGFAKDQFPCEDVEMDLKIRRLGYRLMFNPRAVVGHFRPGDYRAFSRMMCRYGGGEWHLWRKHGFFRKLDYEPWAFLLCVLFALGLLLFEPSLLPLFLAPFLFVFFWFYGKKGSAAASVRFTVLFCITLIFWNWGFFTGFRYRPGT
ncbi:MAG: glycosyltransferase [Deltaproteobacteria bacterium]|nr:glycosyltransferase [Deltaproteobacteria bacterium]